MQSTMKNTEQMRLELERAFDQLDKNKFGFISEAVLRDVLTSSGEKLSHDELDRLIKDADVDRDGKINKKGTYIRTSPGRARLGSKYLMIGFLKKGYLY